ncbi:MAG TPA: hypothetical protein PKA55_15105 [Rhodoblastus sp.]|nr:hypothetical protein [Rhodoblastus sp.]
MRFRPVFFDAGDRLKQLGDLDDQLEELRPTIGIEPQENAFRWK